MPRDVPGYDLGREDSKEEEEEKLEEKEETTSTEEEEGETDEMPLLGYQGKMIIQNVNDMFHDHNQALHKRMDK